MKYTCKQSESTIYSFVNLYDVIIKHWTLEEERPLGFALQIFFIYFSYQQKLFPVSDSNPWPLDLESNTLAIIPTCFWYPFGNIFSHKHLFIITVENEMTRYSNYYHIFLCKITWKLCFNLTIKLSSIFTNKIAKISRKLFLVTSFDITLLFVYRKVIKWYSEISKSHWQSG